MVTASAMAAILGGSFPSQTSASLPTQHPFLPPFRSENLNFPLGTPPPPLKAHLGLEGQLHPQFQIRLGKAV